MVNLFRSFRAGSAALGRRPAHPARRAAAGGGRQTPVRIGADAAAAAQEPAPSAGSGQALSLPKGHAAAPLGGGPDTNRGPVYHRPPQDPELAAIWDAIQRLTDTVQQDHAERLSRIERDLKWVMRISTAMLAAVLGAAAGNLLPM